MPTRTGTANERRPADRRSPERVLSKPREYGQDLLPDVLVSWGSGK